MNRLTQIATEVLTKVGVAILDEAGLRALLGS